MKIMRLILLFVGVVLLGCLQPDFLINAWINPSSSSSSSLLFKQSYHILAFPSLSSTCLFGRALGSKGTGETFFCQSCGAEHVKWAGRCNFCKEWNTIKAFKQVSGSSRASFASKSSPSTSTSSSLFTTPNRGRWIEAQLAVNESFSSMASISVDDQKDRIEIFSREVGRVLGGGLVPGSVILLAGEPGIGKSTLLLQLASQIAQRYGDVIYISGEENEYQIALRGRRLGLPVDRIYLVCDVEIDQILERIHSSPSRPSLVIIDSIQTMRVNDCESSLGSVSQIRESAGKVLQYAKATSTAVILVGHVTKSGDVAGPRVLEHMVDAVVYVEGSDRADYRLVKAVKNRFGSATEVGVLAMTENGLEDVVNPSALFLTPSLLSEAQEGAAVGVVMEGSRALLAEIQCLVTYSYASSSGKSLARRTSDGFPLPRLLLICAVLEKRLKFLLATRDIYLNVVGGLRITEPTADLAVAVALASSLTGLPVRPATAFIGELGLGGELRGGKRTDQRIAEAVKLGFKRIVLPHAGDMSHRAYGKQVELLSCQTLQQALEKALEGNLSTAINKMKKKRSSSTNDARGMTWSAQEGEGEELDEEEGDISP